ncbi:hypothetical protein ACLKA6_019588 [Drosophila palustris]
MKRELLFLLLLLHKSTAWSARERTRKEAKLMISLEHVLHMILTHTCAANNMSIFISTDYREDLPLPEQRLVERVLGKVLRRHSLDAQVPVVMDRKLRNPLNLHVQLMLFFVEDTQQFLRSVTGNAGATSTHKHKFLLVLLAKREQKASETYEKMSQIFRYMLHQRLNIDVLVLLAHLELATLKSYTFFPFGNECESFKPVILPLQQALLTQLYPHKLHNLHGCPLQVIVSEVPPYIEIQPQLKDIQGWDAQLLKTLARKLNFRVELMANEPPDLVGGATYMNGSFTGAYEMLRQRRGNLTLGCAACLPARAKYFSNTVSYNTVEYIIVLPEGKAYSYYEIMLFPFNESTWLLLIVLSFICFIFRLFDAPRFRHLPSPVRLGCIMWLFVLRISYEGSIFRFVHNAPGRPLPQSLEQALRQDYDFIMDPSTFRMAASVNGLNECSRAIPGLPVDMFDQLLQLPQGSRTGLLTSRDFLSYHLDRHREQSHRFVILEQKVLNLILCMHLPLGSYLARSISNLLFGLQSFGICQQLVKTPSWASAVATTSTSKPPRGCDALRPAHDNPFAESMRFLHAAFNCLLFAEFVLILGIFLLELLSLHPQFRWLSWFFHRL